MNMTCYFQINKILTKVIQIFIDCIVEPYTYIAYIELLNRKVIVLTLYCHNNIMFIFLFCV